MPPVRDSSPESWAPSCTSCFSYYDRIIRGHNISCEVTVRKKEIATYSLTCWLIIISFFMVLAGSMNLEILFVLWLIGILIVAELIASHYSKNGYDHRVSVFIALGIVLFGCIVIRKIQVILSQ